jgi:mono/diheme cytochrome c family protein
MKKQIIQLGLSCLLGIVRISYANDNIEIIHCPTEPKAQPGWNLINHGCDIDDNTVQKVTAFIVTKNLCDFSEQTNVFCCYGNKALVRTSGKNKVFTRMGTEKWPRKAFKQDISKFIIQEYVCGPDANKMPFDKCLFSIQPKKTERPHYTELSFKDTMALGNKVYKQFCSTCHKSDATGMLPVILPLRESSSMSQPINQTAHKVICGVTGTLMQPFGQTIDNQEHALTSQELAAIITYVRNEWGNNNKEIMGENAGGAIKPETVDIIRQQCTVCPTCQQK